MRSYRRGKWLARPAAELPACGRASWLNAMTKPLLKLLCMLIGPSAFSQSNSGNESVALAYCISAIERSAAADRSLIAKSGAHAPVRDAAVDSLKQYERSLDTLRARLRDLPDKDGPAMEDAKRVAEADQAAFMKHYEVCWHYCSDEDVARPAWQACIARCTKFDPILSRLDRCRTLD